MHAVRLHTLLALAAAGFLVAGCSVAGPPAGTPFPSSPTTATPPEGPPNPPPSVPAPPPDASAQHGRSPSPDPLLDRHADPALEAMLPPSVAGTTLRTRSLTAAEFIVPAAAAGFGLFVQQVGGNLADVTLASGFDPDGALPGAISALRVPGADQAALLSAYVGLETAQAAPAPTVDQRELGGRVVQALSVGTGPTGLTRYVFSEGEVLFIVDAVEESTASAFIEAVP